VQDGCAVGCLITVRCSGFGWWDAANSRRWLLRAASLLLLIPPAYDVRLPYTLFALRLILSLFQPNGLHRLPFSGTLPTYTGTCGICCLPRAYATFSNLACLPLRFLDTMRTHGWTWRRILRATVAFVLDGILRLFCRAMPTLLKRHRCGTGDLPPATTLKPAKPGVREDVLLTCLPLPHQQHGYHCYAHCAAGITPLCGMMRWIFSLLTVFS
jgi:hypothetical protein